MTDETADSHSDEADEGHEDRVHHLAIGVGPLLEGLEYDGMHAVGFPQSLKGDRVRQREQIRYNAEVQCCNNFQMPW